MKTLNLYRSGFSPDFKIIMIRKLLEKDSSTSFKGNDIFYTICRIIPFKKVIILCSVFIALIFTVHAQENESQDSVMYRIEMQDGNEYIGTIVSEDDEVIHFKSLSLGIITINKSQIKRREQIRTDKLMDGEYWYDNPQESRYFWQPSSYGLKKGEGYYQNVWIFFNQFAYGLSDNFSIGAGLVPLFLFGGGPTPVWLNLKLSIPVVQDKFNLGAGALVGTVIGEDDADFGLLYGLTTFGTRDKNVTLGLGWAYAAGDFANSPTITLSGILRTGKRGYLLTENYLFNTSDETLAVISIGGRRLIGNVSLDFGGFIPISNDIDTPVIIPWLGLIVPFGNNVKNDKR